MGLHGHLVNKPTLTARHQRLRLEFARENLNWNWVDCLVVHLTDESRFNIYQSDGPICVRRQQRTVPKRLCCANSGFGGEDIMTGSLCIQRLLTRVVGNL